MSTAIQMVQQPARADLSVRFSDDQVSLILATCCGGAPPSEAQALIAIAEARGLNPILGECYFVSRWDSKTSKNVWAVQASIDSFRIKAEQTGLYAGQDEPEYEYNAEGLVVLARVKVWRKDWPRPAVGVARWDEYVQTTKAGEPTKFWKQMPHNQLAKCAEALALRKAFPAVLSKLYTADEMMQAESPDYTPPTRQVAPAPVEVTQVRTVDDTIFRSLCDRVDEAETAAALNAVAKDASKAHKNSALSDGMLESIKGAVTRKRALLQAPVPPKSEPRPTEDSGDVDPDNYVGEG